MSELETRPQEADDYLPSVSFDIRLGKRFSFVDFDYDGYINNLRGCGLTDDEIREFSIYIEPERHTVLPRASFKLAPNEFTVSVPRFRAQKAVNTALNQETQRQVDLALGDISPGDKRFYKYYGKVFTVGWFATAGIVGLNYVSTRMWEYTNTTQAIDRVTTVGFVAGVVGLAAYSGSFYFSESESWARKAKKSPEQFIQLQK
jgi:hypothetical protein